MTPVDEPTETSLLDRLVALGWLSQRDIPVIDELGLSRSSDAQLVKGVVLLHAVRIVTG
jgi:hypothetical protein